MVAPFPTRFLSKFCGDPITYLTLAHLFGLKLQTRTADVTTDTTGNLVLTFKLENLNKSVAFRFQIFYGYIIRLCFFITYTIYISIYTWLSPCKLNQKPAI